MQRVKWILLLNKTYIIKTLRNDAQRDKIELANYFRNSYLINSLWGYKYVASWFIQAKLIQKRKSYTLFR